MSLGLETCFIGEGRPALELAHDKRGKRRHIDVHREICVAFELLLDLGPLDPTPDLLIEPVDDRHRKVSGPAIQAQIAPPISGWPSSANVGRLVIAGLRWSEISASGTSGPARICSRTLDSARAPKDTWLPSRSVINGPPPRYGTWLTFGNSPGLRMSCSTTS